MLTRTLSVSLRRRCLLLTLPFFAVACVSEGPLPVPGLKESFHTEIAANGAKRFSYSLEMQHSQVPRPYTGEVASRQRLGRDSMTSGRPSPGARQGGLQFDRALEQKLLETGFCREGYFELERSVSAFAGEVRGECREGAQR